jgi:UDP-glucose 4-epimerase
MNTHTILLTGGAGFIGSHIADAMIVAGHKVVMLDNLSTGSRANLNPNAEFVEGDLLDKELVNKLFAEHKFDVVNHHAAQLDLRKSVDDPVFDAESNILGTLVLLEAARKQCGLKQFVFASSGGAVYGEQDYFPADEQHPTRPISPYGVAKRSIELYLHYYQQVHGINYVAFRYTNVYGPRQSAMGEAGVVAIFIDRLMRGETCTINGAGDQTRDYVYVGDLVRAHVLALESLAGPAIYNICTGKETSVTEIFDKLNAGIGNGSAKPIHGPAKQGEQMRSVCSNVLVEQALGWKPEIGTEDGLAKTVEWFMKRAR